LKFLLKYLDKVVFLKALSWLPWIWSVRLAEARGRIKATLYPQRVRTIANNIAATLSYPREESVSLAVQVFENHSIEEYEAYLYRVFDKKIGQEKIELRGIHYLQEAKERKRGGIIAFWHWGDFLLGFSIVGRMGFQAHVISGAYGPPITDKIDTYHIHQKVMGVTKWIGGRFLVVGNPQTPLKVLRALKGNDFVFWAADARLGNIKEFSEVEFLGRKTLFPHTLCRVSQREGTPILPMHCYRVSRTRVVFEISPPVSVAPGDDYGDVLRGLAGVFEEKIKRYPQYWSYLSTPSNWLNMRDYLVGREGMDFIPARGL
jgi:lauroyl/myristoyl acyltransferase